MNHSVDALLECLTLEGSRAIAIIAIIVVAASFFLPWITLSTSVFGSSVSVSFNEFDLSKNIVTSGGLDLRKLLGAHVLGQEPLNAELLQGYSRALVLAMFLFGSAVVLAIVFLIRVRPIALLGSATLLVASFFAPFSLYRC